MFVFFVLLVFMEICFRRFKVINVEERKWHPGDIGWNKAKVRHHLAGGDPGRDNLRGGSQVVPDRRCNKFWGGGGGLHGWNA